MTAQRIGRGNRGRAREKYDTAVMAIFVAAAGAGADDEEEKQGIEEDRR